ncbi:hypothetical protein IMG5_063020 [Ichthyophthirius multifiliis]|uniref:Transmembrane protein n=1 Tax=Ichthyophthirius multifiliis TaxID=5932 RepID=G0QP04_ICHMU|nr:hypothetical protein IMG5_063020 [Ichthyophthirius multifiliis]EGR33047.1 hypothetical protein IMG5_063020 [Ichthyophthirius multifiliis]|eukprot:XP_004037033.1 hypothetical protein IMG5_063020 [Ichthyophthirius multifiliis]
MSFNNYSALKLSNCSFIFSKLKITSFLLFNSLFNYFISSNKSPFYQYYYFFPYSYSLFPHNQHRQLQSISPGFIGQLNIYYFSLKICFCKNQIIFSKSFFKSFYSLQFFMYFASSFDNLVLVTFISFIFSFNNRIKLSLLIQSFIIISFSAIFQIYIFFLNYIKILQ